MKIKTTALLMSLIIGMTLTASASIILVNDDFTDGNTDGWSVKDATGANGGGTLTVQNDSSGINSGNAMLLATTSKTRFATIGLSQAVNLGVGDSITLTMDYRYVYGASNVNSSLAFKLIDSTASYGDYMGVGINPLSTSASTSWFLRNGVVEGSKWANDFVHDLTAESVTFVITRDSSDKANYSISWDGGSTFTKIGSVAADPANDFKVDTLQIGFAGVTTGGFLLDNVTLSTTVPEPATIGMLGLGALITLLARRIRN